MIYQGLKRPTFVETDKEIDDGLCRPENFMDHESPGNSLRLDENLNATLCELDPPRRGE